MRALLLILDLIFSARPIVLVPVWGFAIFGYAAAFRHSGIPYDKLIFQNNSLSLNSFILILVFSLSVAAVYLANQIADRDVDLLNGGLPLISSGIVGVRDAWISFVAASLLSIIIPILMGSPLISLCSISGILLGIIYSFRPFFFSGRPYLDFLSNAAGFGLIAFAAGWFSSGLSFDLSALVVGALPYFLLMAAGSISSTIPDMEGDRACSKITTSVHLGSLSSHILAFVFIVGGVFVAYINNDIPALAGGLCSIPLYAAYLFRPSSKALMEATYKVGGAVLMIFAAVIMPILAIAGISVLVATAAYFRFRHGVSYPSLVAVGKPND